MEIIEVKPGDSLYPYALEEIFDPPARLYMAGNIELLKKPSVAIVGSRRCTEYGRTAAAKLAKKLSINNICVVSGMAMGIDSFAHMGALDAEGSTIAVLGGGIENVFPKSNKNLRDRILQAGLIISEHYGDYTPHKYDFPLRNRIISGLCRATIVIEAAEQSGSLITAESAMEQNREVYALPGNITSKYSQGTNRLIKEGAQPLINFNDVIRDLGFIPREEKNLNGILGADEMRIYELINKWGEVSKGYVYSAAGFPEEKTNGLLMLLEMKGLIKSSMGKIFIA